MNQPKAGTDGASSAVLEFGHVYLDSIIDASYKVDTGLAVETYELLDYAGYDVTTLVVIDDTSTPESLAEHEAAVNDYIHDLGLEVDDTVTESSAGSAIEDVLANVPRIHSEGELGQSDSWGYWENADKGYVYGTNGAGESKPKVKVKDTTPASPKITPWTCQAYDAGMALAKTGVFDAPGFPSGEMAVTVHDGFTETEPYQKSQELQNILIEQGVTEDPILSHWDFDNDLHNKSDVEKILEKGGLL